MEQILKNLPSVREILDSKKIKSLTKKYPSFLITESVRGAISRKRALILKDRLEKKVNVDDFVNDVLKDLEKLKGPELRKVVNCTGVVIHTNLGRAPLASSALENLLNIGTSYSNLEYSIPKGERGSRNIHCLSMIKALLGVEDALIVNNNASALLLILTTFSKRKEVIISRGEIVEIGGGFRVNEIMNLSGCILREVGTTNKTRLEDYRSAINEKTRIILKIHPSNFKIIGFEESSSLQELVSLGSERGILTVFDAGSGLLAELKEIGLQGEVSMKESLKSKVDLILFSGDKLLGGPQAGIIAGKSELISKMKKHPLFRVLRVCKLTLSALEGTLRHYVIGDHLNQIPVLRMMVKSLREIEKESKYLSLRLKNIDKRNEFEINTKKSDSHVGGGTYPTVSIETRVIALKGKSNPSIIAKFFRDYETPVIVRIEKNEVLLDLRTVLKQEFTVIERAFEYVTHRLVKR